MRRVVLWAVLSIVFFAIAIWLSLEITLFGGHANAYTDNAQKIEFWVGTATTANITSPNVIPNDATLVSSVETDVYGGLYWPWDGGNNVGVRFYVPASTRPAFLIRGAHLYKNTCEIPDASSIISAAARNANERRGNVVSVDSKFSDAEYKKLTPRLSVYKGRRSTDVKFSPLNLRNGKYPTRVILPQPASVGYYINCSLNLNTTGETFERGEYEVGINPELGPNGGDLTEINSNFFSGINEYRPEVTVHFKNEIHKIDELNVVDLSDQFQEIKAENLSSRSFSRDLKQGESFHAYWSDSQKEQFRDLAILLIGILYSVAITALVEAIRPAIERNPEN